MAAAILNDQTILCYVADEQAFDRAVIDHFTTLDADGDGTVSLNDLRRGFGKSAAMDEEDIEGQCDPEVIYNAVFERFDEDRDGMLNSTEFRSLYLEMMLCLACGIGGVPVLAALQDGSPFLNAVEHERNTVPLTPAAPTKPCKCHNRPSRSKEAKVRFPRLFVCFCGSQSQTVS